MNYKILFIASIIIFISLSVVDVVVLSSGRIQVGTPVCEIFTDNGGARCASIRCSGTDSSDQTCYDDTGNVTTLFDQTAQICEFPPGGCTVIAD